MDVMDMSSRKILMSSKTKTLNSGYWKALLKSEIYQFWPSRPGIEEYNKHELKVRAVVHEVHKSFKVNLLICKVIHCW